MSAWDFVNSSFGLWVLSSVVLASLSRLFLVWRDSSSRRAAARSEREDLLLEIEVRTRNAMAHAANPRTAHLANSGPLNGPIPKYTGRDYLQLLIEAECRLGDRIKTGTLTERAQEIARTDTNNAHEVRRIVELYRELLSEVQARRMRG